MIQHVFMPTSASFMISYDSQPTRPINK